MFNLYVKEVLSYFNSLIGYFAIALFLLVAGLVVWVFPDSSILNTGYASLDIFFNIAPYLFIFLVPVIMMRSIAGEKMEGTYDLLLSRPLCIEQIIIAKFFAGATVVILAIIPTIVYVVSIYSIAFPVGNIDLGAIVGSYLGLLLLASGFIAISLFCSCISNNPIIAFLLAVLFNFLMFYAFGTASDILSYGYYEEFLRTIGMQEHYLALSRGVILADDLFYFLGLITFFIVLSIGHSKRGFVAAKKILTTYLITLVIVVVINLDSINIFFDRIDFTEDKRYTLSPTTREILASSKEDINITIFLDGDLPAGFKRLRQAIIAMVDDLKSYAKGTITINSIDPLAGNMQEQREFTTALINSGLYPTNLNVKTTQGNAQKLIFPFAIISSGGKEMKVNFLQNRTGQTADQILNNSIQNLEYAFLSAISKIQTTQVPYIGFTEGHGEASDLELYDAMHSLSLANRVGRVNLETIAFDDLKRIKVLVIAKPTTRFSEEDKYKIDYYVRHGGAIIWAIDQIDAAMSYIRQSCEQPLLAYNLNLDDQLFLYGARLNYEIIADLNCALIPISVGNIGGQAQIELMPWYFFPIIMPTTKHAIVKNLDGIRTEFVGTVDTIPAKGITKEVLLTSSPFNEILKIPSMISLQMLEKAPDPSRFKGDPYPIAILLTGKFPYVYENRPAPAGIIEPVDLLHISKTAKMIVLADGDWLINQVNAKDQSPFPLGWDRYNEQQFANKVFLENAIDYLMNDEKLISLRNRELKLRLIDKSISQEDKLKWQIINVGLPVVLLIVVGLLQHYLRKLRYGRKICVEEGINKL